ncbi:PEP/pyruvate-binding domain-containing protein [Lachnospiraceae bacterium ZAX-1]
MAVANKVSTGLSGFDQVIDMLWLGDNVVWQVQSMKDYVQVVEPFIRQAKSDQRRLVYFRFGSHPPLMAKDEPDIWYDLDASEGFESFATRIHSIIEQEGRKVFYVFDCLSDLLEFWYSDLMIGNFFKVTCPFLYQLDTIAYFALKRGAHTYNTVARIRETTQLLLDLYTINNQIYIHPLKVWKRYSPTMFFPHLIKAGEAVSITASTEAAELFSGLYRSGQVRDFWEETLERARKLLGQKAEEQEQMKELLISLIIGREPRIVELSRRYLTLQDILKIASKEIGTGFVGGKSVGMLLARKILQTDARDMLKDHWEHHDSYYLGSDVFYTYIVQNGWWELRTKQKTAEGYFALAEELKEKLLHGVFPDRIREQFIQMLEYYGQSPIIVRSSSLLEDNYGNAFAGKYESVFCANQGSPDDRYEAFEQAVRTVYASTMTADALAYRMDRGLTGKDEQMAILVQRVSGDHYGEFFFPHIAGVGNSVNLYLWDRDMDPEAGMLRLVFGLGTRAVDRLAGDYARIVSLDRPDKGPPVNYGDEKKFSQHKADVLNLRENCLDEISLNDFLEQGMRVGKNLLFSPDLEMQRRLAELGRTTDQMSYIADFKKLLGETDFPKLIRTVFSTLRNAYQYPVDIEFTANFTKDGTFKLNLLQCRPLQTKGLGRAAVAPTPKPTETLFASTGSFMGGNIRLALDYVLFVKAHEYLALSERDKYSLARLIGELNQKLQPHKILLIGPGRWGTTTPSLGVPVHFTELSHMAAICEVSYREGGLMPELSFGSHFFQDIVESDIFYAAIFDGKPEVVLKPELFLKEENQIEAFVEANEQMLGALYLAKMPGLVLYADIVTQKLICFIDRDTP